jgi:hypothetical protein
MRMLMMTARSTDMRKAQYSLNVVQHAINEKAGHVMTGLFLFSGIKPH